MINISTMKPISRKGYLIMRISIMGMKSVNGSRTRRLATSGPILRMVTSGPILQWTVVFTVQRIHLTFSSQMQKLRKQWDCYRWIWVLRLHSHVCCVLMECHIQRLKIYRSYRMDRGTIIWIQLILTLSYHFFNHKIIHGTYQKSDINSGAVLLLVNISFEKSEYGDFRV